MIQAKNIMGICPKYQKYGLLRHMTHEKAPFLEDNIPYK
jgi:hypothetical protein